MYHFKKTGGNRKGSKLTPKQLIQWSECKKGKNNYWYGRSLSDNHKKNISIAKTGIKMGSDFCITQSNIRKLKLPKGQWANFNELACEYFDWLNMFMNWNGNHAKNGGEVRLGRYTVDYYEPNLNLVIEWDENHHYNKYGNLKDEDMKRQRKIIDALDCRFYRISNDEFLNDKFSIIKFN